MASTEAQKAKDKGNAAFKAGNFPESIGYYTEAILADRNDPTYPLNRAAAYLKLGKNEDADRDCSTVLRLKAGHVKALYRRAQARIEMRRLDEARKDLNDALNREPNNDSVKMELKKVDDLIKGSTKSKDTVNQSTLLRRRVPIEVVESTRSDVASSSSMTETLIPTSSRTFPRKPSSKESLPTPSPSPTLESRATSDMDSTPSSRTEGSSKATKPAPSPRGGIFRPSGEHTLFRVPTPDTPTSQTVVIAGTGNANGRNANASSSAEKEPAAVVQPSPMSLFEFLRSWELGSTSKRWDIICQIPPPAVPSLFKTSLDASLLTSLLEVFTLAASTAGEPAVKARIREYLEWLPLVPRFATVLLFLSNDERGVCRTLFETVGGVGGWKI